MRFLRKSTRPRSFLTPCSRSDCFSVVIFVIAILYETGTPLVNSCHIQDIPASRPPGCPGWHTHTLTLLKDTPPFYSQQRATTSAGRGSRTPVIGLENRDNNRYTIPARVVAERVGAPGYDSECKRLFAIRQDYPLVTKTPRHRRGVLRKHFWAER